VYVLTFGLAVYIHIYVLYKCTRGYMPTADKYSASHLVSPEGMELQQTRLYQAI